MSTEPCTICTAIARSLAPSTVTGENYVRAIADELATFWRLTRENRHDEASYFLANAERYAAKYGIAYTPDLGGVAS